MIVKENQSELHYKEPDCDK